MHTLVYYDVPHKTRNNNDNDDGGGGGDDNDNDNDNGDDNDTYKNNHTEILVPQGEEKSYLSAISAS